MNNFGLLKQSALSFMEESQVLRKFRDLAEKHSLDCSRHSDFSPAPLILDFEVDLHLLRAFSESLYDNLVEYPTEGRRIFREALNDCLEEWLRSENPATLTCVQLMLRCRLSSMLRDGTNLYAKSYRCLSYFQRFVLTSVSILGSDTCNLSTICALTRCSDPHCPGRSGNYIPMEELKSGINLMNCKDCGKKCYEDAAGRGAIQKVLAKFTSVLAFNCHDEKAFHDELTCSITDPLIDYLELGEMYTIWGHYEASIFEIWGLERTSFFHKGEIHFSTLPTSVQSLWTSFGEKGPNDAWSFARALSLELGSRIYRKNAAMSLKMGLLLSLASAGNDKHAPVLCVGPNIGELEEDVIRYAANCADRNVAVNFPIHANTVRNDQRIWLLSGSLLKAKTGVCVAGDWESLKMTEKKNLLQALDDGYIIKTETHSKMMENNKTPFLASPFPLKTAVWSYSQCKNNDGHTNSLVLQNLVNLFGVPFLADVDKLTEDSVAELCELIFNGGETNPRKVPMAQLVEFLRIVNGREVKLSEEAVNLMEHYFVVSRRVRNNTFPSQSITFLKTLAQAHARVSLRTEVTYDDVVAIIYLYEESMCFLYGPPVSACPHFVNRRVYEIGEKMESFKVWLKSYLG